MKVRQGLLKFISHDAPREVRLRAATGEALSSEGLPSHEKLTVFFALSYDKDREVSEAARTSLESYPSGLVVEALDARLEPLVIKRLVEIHRDNEAVLIMAALNPGTDDETLKNIAETGPEEVLEVLQDDEERLMSSRAVMEGVRKNPLAPKSLLNKIDAALAGPQRKEYIPHAPKDDRPKKELLDEGRGDEQNILKLMQSLSTGQKIKLAITGNKSAREYLIKDTNKVVSIAVLKNPRITEEEIARLTSSKGTPEDLLRQVARNKEWYKNYTIKLNMIVNPKTPLPISLKLLDHLHEKDLTNLSKSKNIPSVLASTARRKLETKKK